MAVGVTVPEAPVDENDRLPGRKHNVWGAWQAPHMKSVSQTSPMEQAPQQQLRSRVPTGYSRHHSRPRRLVDYVCHGRLICCSEPDMLFMKGGDFRKV